MATVPLPPSLPPSLERGSRFRVWNRERKTYIQDMPCKEIDIQLVGVVLTFGTELTETRT